MEAKHLLEKVFPFLLNPWRCHQVSLFLGFLLLIAGIPTLLQEGQKYIFGFNIRLSLPGPLRY